MGTEQRGTDWSLKAFNLGGQAKKKGRTQKGVRSLVTSRFFKGGEAALTVNEGRKKLKTDSRKKEPDKQKD